MSEYSLEEILHPRSIAVVGASANARGPSFVSPLKQCGFKGDIYPVNPKYEEVLGLKTYARVTDIPGPVDYVISSIPAAAVLDLVADCADKGVKCIHLFTARFSETGRRKETELEQEILRQAQAGGIRLIGPNCLGVYNPKMGIAFHENMPRESGPVALISQSGGGVGEIVETAEPRGLRFSKAISYGNALDFNECDYLAYFAQDPETEIILMYIEGLRDPRRFQRVLRDATAVKPVVILKGGRGSAGTRATASHTGSMAGTRTLWDSMVKQGGAISAEDTEEIVDIAVGLCFSPPILGRRTAVAGGSGGGSVWAADLCEEAGLDVIDLPQDIRDELKRRGSTIWDWLGNPADFSIAMGDPTGGMDIMKLMAAHPDFDLLIVFMSAPWGGKKSGDVSIEDHMKQYHLREVAGKPMIVILQSRPAGPPIGDKQRLAGIMTQLHEYMNKEKWPVFPSIKRAANAAAKVIEYYERKPI
ncbi:MAG: CoA-binding protein [Desulfobacterales bacterium]